MGTRGEIYSSKEKFGERTYFFNVHENFRGDLSLNIVESKESDREGQFIRQSVLVYEENLDSFLSELQKAIDVMRKKMDAKN